MHAVHALSRQRRLHAPCAAGAQRNYTASQSMCCAPHTKLAALSAFLGSSLREAGPGWQAAVRQQRPRLRLPLASPSALPCSSLQVAGCAACPCAAIPAPQVAWRPALTSMYFTLYGIVSVNGDHHLGSRSEGVCAASASSSPCPTSFASSQLHSSIARALCGQQSAGGQPAP